MNPYGYTPPAAPLDEQRRALRQEGRFIGTGMLFLILLSQFLYMGVVYILLFTGAVSREAAAADDLGLGNTGYLLVYLGIYVVMMGLPMAVAALLYRRPIQPFAPAKRISPLTFAGGLLGGLAMCVVANIATSYCMSFFNALGIPTPDMPEWMVQTPVSFWLNLLVFAAAPAVLEEMVFRGYVLQALRPYGARTAVLVSSLLFALMHGNILQVPFALLVGLTLGYVVVQTNNIWLAVCIHFANNAMSSTLQYIQLSMTSETEQNRLTLMTFSILGILGAAAILLLAAKRHPLSARPEPNAGGASTGSQFAALCRAPAFLASLIVFVLLILLSVAISVLGAGAAS